MTEYGWLSNDNNTTKHYSTHHDWEGPGFLHGTIIKAVSTITKIDMETIAAKYEIDHSRAIENLFITTETERQRSNEFVQFVLTGVIVRVYGDGQLIAESKSE
ncbi:MULTISPECIES: hypothetical protein [unclassified Haloferax]|uniref:hypothetical protein n=1 Tax=unclassified Haloferax TaxID=2625095 RepID=UPI00135F137F|nr:MULTISPECIES: hypothetical protein [unclassified Haloferax]